MVSDDLMSDDLRLVLQHVQEAGEIALSYFGASNDNDVWHKGGNSPVSEADMAVNKHLLDTLRKARPDYGWLSEETDDDSVSKDVRKNAEATFVVDPIDGTRGFIHNLPEWCISVGIVRDGETTEAVLHCPSLEETFIAETGRGTSLNGKKLSRDNENHDDSKLPLVTGSRKLIEIIEKNHGRQLATHPFIPSLAYRLAMVADGRLDGAFARAGAHDWDIAAADLILREAGCRLTSPSGLRPVFNTGSIRADALVAGPVRAHATILDIAKRAKFLH